MNMNILKQIIKEALLQDVGYEEEFIEDANVVLSELFDSLTNNFGYNIHKATQDAEFNLNAKMLTNMLCEEFQSYPLAVILLDEVIKRYHDDSKVLHVMFFNPKICMADIKSYICWLIYVKINNIDTNGTTIGDAIIHVSELNRLIETDANDTQLTLCIENVYKAFARAKLKFAHSPDALRGFIKTIFDGTAVYTDRLANSIIELGKNLYNNG